MFLIKGKSLLRFDTAQLTCFLSRFRQIPAFGQGTIRTFSKNMSEMKQMAARDFEDILQVSSISQLSCLTYNSYYFCSAPSLFLTVSFLMSIKPPS